MRMTPAFAAVLDQMSEALADYIRASLKRAAEADQLASREADPVAKAELQELANAWRKVAADYQYVEKLENFMETFKAPDKPMSAH